MKRGAVAWVLVLVVPAMHGLLIGWLNLASQPRRQAVADVQRIAAQRIAVILPPPSVMPEVAARSAAEPPTGRLPAAPARKRPATAVVQQEARGITATDNVAPSVPGPPPAPQARPLDLNSDAIRRALRDTDRNRSRSFAEQSNDALGNASRPSAEGRLDEGIAAARKGDCMRGEFKPWAIDVGLGPEYKLPLPGVVRAMAVGECASLNR